MTIVGGVLEEMGQLGAVFRQNGQSAQHIKSIIDSTLASTTWTGPAADRFREQWAQFSPALTQLDQAFTEASIEVDRRRQALDEATR